MRVFNLLGKGLGLGEANHSKFRIVGVVVRCAYSIGFEYWAILFEKALVVSFVGYD